MFPKVTIIGRPNVGKSSFFNMFVGHKIAVVADEPGTTRDVSEYEYHDEVREISYILCDSGGLDFSSKNDAVSTDIIERTKKAIEDSDALLWLIEYDKFTDLDEYILKIVQKANIPVLIAANKADNESATLQAFSLPVSAQFEYFFPVSVSHHTGFSDLKDTLSNILKEKGYEYLQIDEEDDSIKLALVGRPNVGKSSLINAILGKNRVMVQDFSGTTRDSVDSRFEYEGNPFILIDTAGIRRLSKIGTRNIENWSVMRTQRSIGRADIVGVVIDGVDGIAQQDLSIISSVLEEKKGLFIVINKWDLVLAKEHVKKETIMGKYMTYLQEKFDFLPWVNVIFTSAVEQKRTQEILETAIKIHHERNEKRVKTSIFNSFLEQVIAKHPPTGTRVAHKPKIYYGSQVDVNPPKFVLTVNNPEHFHFSYKRYLENRIRDNFGFSGTPIVIEYKGRGKTKEIVG